MDEDFETKIKIEKFAERLENDIFEIKRFVSFLNADEQYKKKLNKGIEQLEAKLKNIKKCRTVKEANKYLKVKKLNKNFGDDDERQD